MDSNPIESLAICGHSLECQFQVLSHSLRYDLKMPACAGSTVLDQALQIIVHTRILLQDSHILFPAAGPSKGISRQECP
jgi:hypothetical protein